VTHASLGDPLSISMDDNHGELLMTATEMAKMSSGASKRTLGQPKIKQD